MTSILSLAAPILLAFAQASGGAVALASAEYRVGPGDVLEVLVAGRPDLSRLPTVQTTGAVFLPRAGEVKVVGLTVGEIGGRIAPLLVADDLQTPEVSVRLRHYQSQFVWVQGEVLRPGRKPLRAGTRLIDALLDAGGFTSRASGEIRIERRNGTFPDGNRSLVVRLGGGTPPSPEEVHELSRHLQNGDLVVAATQHWVIVSGEVGHPGRYPLEDDLTLSQLLESAGGLTPFGSDLVTVRRGDARGNMEVDLGAVRAGETLDPVLSPGDHVVVRARRL